MLNSSASRLLIPFFRVVSPQRYFSYSAPVLPVMSRSKRVKKRPITWVDPSIKRRKSSCAFSEIIVTENSAEGGSEDRRGNAAGSRTVGNNSFECTPERNNSETRNGSSARSSSSRKTQQDKMNESERRQTRSSESSSHRMTTSSSSTQSPVHPSNKILNASCSVAGYSDGGTNLRNMSAFSVAKMTAASSSSMTLSSSENSTGESSLLSSSSANQSSFRQFSSKTGTTDSKSTAKSEKSSSSSPKKSNSKSSLSDPKDFENRYAEFKDAECKIEKIVRKQRKWIFTPAATKLKHSKNSAHHPFTLMTFNVLAQNLMLDNPDLYSHCKQKILEWEYRREAIIREIRNAKADVICLQEVQEEHFGDFFELRMLELGYDSCFKSRTGNKRDGCAIFWKTAEFEASGEPKKIEYFQRGDRLMDRDNVAIIVSLKSRKLPDAPTLHVATTHLLFNPRRGDIKLAQLRKLLAELDAISASKPSDSASDASGYDPVILCGDLNCVPFSPLHAFLSQGQLDFSSYISGAISGQPDGVGRGRPIDIHHSDILVSSQYKDVLGKRVGNQTVLNLLSTPNTRFIGHPFMFASTYMHKYNNKPEITTHHQKASCTVDYIFYHFEQKGTIAPLLHLASLSLLSENDLTKMNGLPNEYLGSDHISLVAKFALRPVAAASK